MENTTQVPVKSVFKSKTAIVNLLVFLAPFIPGVEEFIQTHPEAILHGIGILGILLRLVTKGKIELIGNDKTFSLFILFLIAIAAVSIVRLGAVVAIVI